MSILRVTDFAEAQAIGLCWMARQTGLPEVHVLRAAVAQLHPSECGWCAYPPEVLMEALKARRVVAGNEVAYWHLPSKARLGALATAQGFEGLVL